jgi:hypothetical protein
LIIAFQPFSCLIDALLVSLLDGQFCLFVCLVAKVPNQRRAVAKRAAASKQDG